MPKRRVLLFVLPIVVVLLLAGCGGDDDSSSAGATTTAMDHETATTAVSGDELDKAFVTAMIPHHQAAVDMANVELQKGTNTEVRQMAQAVVDAQEKEITELSDIAKRKWNTTPAHAMTGPMGTMMGVPMSMDMSTMAEELSAESNVDHAFLQMMIPHHASAIGMAHEELEHGEDAALKTMSEAIIAAQAKEIGEMQSLLSKGV